MSGLGFLCILRDSGTAAADLCADIAAVTKPGDEVILLDDSGPGVSYHTSAVVGRFDAMAGWPEGVRVQRITTGLRGAGDEGIAVNLALVESEAERLVILPGTARLAAGFVAARAQAEGDDLDLLTCAAEVLGSLDLNAPSAQIGRLIFRKSLVQSLFCVEGAAGGGVLRLIRGIGSRAVRRGVTSEVAVLLPPLPPVTPDWIGLWETEAREDPGWALPLLSEQLTGAVPGARAVLSAALAGVLPDLADDALPNVAGADVLQEALRHGAKAFRVPVAATAQIGQARLKILSEGRHRHRSPLAYPALAPLWQGIADLVEDPAQADLIVYAHPRDLSEMTMEAARVIERQGDVPVALISEEPFWDTLFSPDPLAEAVALPAAWLGEVRVTQVNHHRSAIFDFDHFPYFTLTDPAYAERYARMFTRNAALSAEDWAAAFAKRADQAVFMAERRPEGFHDFEIGAGGIVGLCAWRTRLAEAYQTGTVARLGASWQGGVPRQDLPDWHADKMAQLDGRARLISAIENTHQPTYLSEKLFDAFACGGRPLYVAQGSHRVHGLGLPEECWINLAGCDASEAGVQMDAAPWGSAFYRAYAEAQTTLAALWSDTALQRAETERLGRALRAELLRLA